MTYFLFDGETIGLRSLLSGKSSNLAKRHINNTTKVGNDIDENMIIFTLRKIYIKF